VLANLLRNSVEAFADVRVQVRVAVVEEVLELSVSDDGPGIPDELRERVFDPFVSTKERGTGLGLPLAVRVLSYLGGSIELLPARVRGAAFLIRVPVESRATAVPTPGGAAPAAEADA
jgi:signal transduction histidine kinase